MAISDKFLGLLPLCVLISGCGTQKQETSGETQGEITKYQSGWINKKNNVELFFGLTQVGNSDRACFYGAKHDQNLKDQNGKLLAPKSDLAILKTSKPIAAEFVSIGLLKKSVATLTQSTAAAIVRISSEQTQCSYMSKYLTPKAYDLYTGMFVNGSRPDLLTNVRDCKNYVTRRVEKLINDSDTGAIVKSWVNERVFAGTYDSSCIEDQIVVLCQADKRVQMQSLNSTLSSFKSNIDLVASQALAATDAAKPVTPAMLTATQLVSTSNMSSALASLKAERITAPAFGGSCPAPKF